MSIAAGSEQPPRSRPIGRDQDWPLILLLGIYIAVSAWLAWRIPSFSGPNEGLHYEVSAWLARYGELPDPALSVRADERHQPPFYYLVATIPAIFLDDIKLDTEFPGNPHYIATHRGNLNAKIHAGPQDAPLLYTGRLLSVLFGAVGVIALYFATRLTSSVATSLLVATLLAFQPNYLYLNSMFSNDGPVAAMAAVVVSYSTWLMLKPRQWRTYIVWGMIFAVAMLTKANAVVAGLSFVPLWIMLMRRRSAAIRALGGAALGFVPLWGSWLLYNRGRAIDALAIERSLPPARLIGLSPADLPLIGPHLQTIWRSYWLDWSAGEVGFAPDQLYCFGFGFTLFALLGWSLYRRRARQCEQTVQPNPVARVYLLAAMHTMIVLALVLLFISVKTLMVKETGMLVAEGRWMAPLMPSLAWLTGIGWSCWWPTRLRRPLTWMTILVVVTALILLIDRQIPRLYPLAHRLPATAETVASSSDLLPIHYGDQLALNHVFLADRALRVGAETAVDLWWQALRDPQEDYTVSLQLLAPDGPALQKLDIQNTLTGGGVSPTSRWRAGEQYRDRIVLKPDAILNGPTQAILALWILDDYRNNSTLRPLHAGMAIDPPVVDHVVVYPHEQPLPPATARLSSPVQFGDDFKLIASTVESSSAGMELTLWWESLQATRFDYTVFAHLTADGELPVEQADAQPDGGRSPTSIWQPGDIVRDSHHFSTQPALSATFLVGLYRVETLERLPATQAGELLTDSAVRIGIR